MSTDVPGAGAGSREEPAAAPTCYRHPSRETWIRCQRCDRPICPDCMHSASVGYQCPTCVKEGRASTRSGTAAYGGARTTDPRLTSIVLIALNAAVWLAIVATGGSGSPLVDRLGLIPQGQCAASRPGFYLPGFTQAMCSGHVGVHWLPGVADGAVWQLLTSMFTQVEIWHIGFNMVALWFLGPQLEAILGRTRFLAVYLVSGLIGSAAVMWFSAPATPTYGASGAIFGLLGALLVVALKIGADVRQILFWIVLNVAFTFTAAGISWEAHLGGLAGGALLAAIIVYAPRARRTPVQWSGVGAVLLVTLVLVGLRAAALG